MSRGNLELMQTCHKQTSLDISDLVFSLDEVKSTFTTSNRAVRVRLRG